MSAFGIVGRNRARGRKTLAMLAALSLLMTMVVQTSFGAGLPEAEATHASGTFVVTADAACGTGDADGVPPCIDDVPAQSDINSMGVNESHLSETNPYLVVFGTFDNTTLSGANTADVCAFLDIDGDGFTDFTVCSSLSSTGGTTNQFQFQPDRSVAASSFPKRPLTVWDCTDNEQSAFQGQRCKFSGGGSDGSGELIAYDNTTPGTPPDVSSIISNNSPEAIANSFNVIGAGDTTAKLDQIADIFHSGQLDTRVTWEIYLNDLIQVETTGVSPSAVTLLNVCTLTSPGPGSSTSDCIVPAGAGFIVIEKDAGGDTATGFEFSVDGGTAVVVKEGTPVSVAVDADDPATHTVAETLPTDWSLTTASCDDGSSGLAGTTISGIVLAAGQTVTCVFTNTDFVPNPVLQITKTPATQTIESGSSAVFTVTVSNGGNVDLTNVTVTDAQCTTLAPNATYDSTLTVGEVNTYTCTVTNVTTGFTNTATATSTETGPKDATADVEVADFTLVKSPATQVVESGTDAVFTITMTNTGEVPLSGITLIDAQCDTLTADAGNTDPLALNGVNKWTCTVEDVETGFTNTATGDTAQTASKDATADVEVADFTLVKSPATQVVESGTDAVFTITMTNTGEVPLSGITLIDAQCDTLTADAGNTDPLALNGVNKWTCTVEDVETGFTNTATGDTAQTASKDATADVEVADFTLVKSPATQVVESGTDAVFTITMTNTGEVPLSGITLTDAQCDTLTADAGNTDPLALNGVNTWTCTVEAVETGFTNTATGDTAQTEPKDATADVDVADFTLVKSPATQVVESGTDAVFTITMTNTGEVPLSGITLTDAQCDTLTADAGNTDPLALNGVNTWTCTVEAVTAGFTNTATGDTAQTEPKDATADVDVADFTLVKSPATQVVESGTDAVFTITMTNTGEVPLSGITLTDAQCDTLTPGAGNTDPLAVNGVNTWTCTVEAVTAGFTNTATGDTAQTAPKDATADVDVADFTLVKSPATQVVESGTDAVFTITMTNTGEVPLSGITLTDAQCDTLTPGAGNTDPLAVNGVNTWTCTVEAVTAGFTNTATGDTAQTAPKDATADVDVADFTLVKSPATQVVESGTDAVFTITMTNTGEVPLSGITLTDAQCDTLTPGAGNTDPLAVNGVNTWTCTVEAVTAGFTNTATGDTAQTAPKDATADVDVADFTLVKSPATQVVESGTDAVFTITMTNTGEVPLSGITLTDAQCDTLTPGAGNTDPLAVNGVNTWTCTVEAVTAGFTNTATGDTAQTAPKDATADVDVADFTLVKSPATQVVESGTDAVFTITMTNTGEVPLSGITLTDAQCDTLTPGAGNTDPLAVNGVNKWTCTVEAVETGFTNTATGDTAQTEPKDATADVDVANLTIAKTPLNQTVLTGTSAVFTITVTNTGEADLTGVTLTDAQCTTLVADTDNTSPTLLESGASDYWTCTVTNVTEGFINTATVDTEQTEPKDAAATVAVASPGYTVEKQVSVDGGTNWVDADTATGPELLTGNNPQFRVIATNTGNVPVSLDVSDPTLSGLDVTGVTLAVGDTNKVISGPITGTWAEGQQTNTATVAGEYTDPDGDKFTDSQTDNANYFGADPSYTVEKQVSVDGGTTWLDADTATGPELLTGFDPQFRVIATNTGNVAVSLDVSDSDFTSLSATDFNLAVGATNVVVAGPVTESWTKGQHTNTATIDADYSDDGGHTYTNQKTDNANYFGADPSYTVEKQVSVDGGTTWLDADTATGPELLTGFDPQFRVIATNTGNVPVSLDVSDSDFTSLSATDFNLAVGATNVVVAGPVTESWTKGQHTNTATIDADYSDDGGHTYTNQKTDNANYFGADPSYTVEKQVSVDGGTTWLDADTATGPELLTGNDPQFRVIATNTGNVPVSLDVSDSDFTSLSATDFNLAVGATNVVVAGPVTESWTKGQHTNTATIDADYSDDGGHTYTNQKTDNANYFGADPSYTVEKQVSVDGGTTWLDADTATGPELLTGNDPQFRVIATNTGNVPVSLDVSDSDFASLTATDVVLAVGDGTTPVVVAGPVTEAWAEGQHTNTATVAGEYTDDGNHKFTDSQDDAANYFGANPSYTVEKQVSVDGGTTWLDADTATGPELLTGNDPQFRVIATNTGNVPVSLDVSDSDFASLTATDVVLAVGDGTTPVVVAGPVTESWAEGQHSNTATIDADYSDDGGHTYTNQKTDDANYFGANPSYTVAKQVSVDGGTTWLDADTVTGPELLTGNDPQFRVIATNTGNVDVTVGVSDPDLSGLDVSGVTLAVGATNVVLSSATGSWAEGQQTNTATVAATYTDDGNHKFTDSQDDDANYFGANPSYTVAKQVSVDGGTTWLDADTVTGPELLTGNDPQFRVIATNTGNVPVSLDVSDSDFASLTATDVVLAVGDGTTPVVIAGPVTESWAEGQHSNTATIDADYSDDGGHTYTNQKTDDANYFGANPSYTVAKQVSVDGGTTWLDADTVTGPELLTGNDPQFRVIATNTGNVDVSLDVSDSDFASLTATDVVLAVGDGTTPVVIAGPVTESWVEGQHSNTATIDADYSDDGGHTYTNQKTDDANYFGANPDVSIVKTFTDDSVIAGNAASPFNVVSSFTMLVTNEGNVPLTDVLVTDTVDDRLEVSGLTLPSGWVDLDNDGDAGTGDGNPQTIEVLYAGPFGVDAEATITVNFSVDASESEALAVPNTADVDGDYADDGGHSTTVDGTSTDTIDILTEIDLDILKTFYAVDDKGTNTTADDELVASGQIEQGTAGFFTLVVTNDGPSYARDVTVTDTVNALLEVTSVEVTTASSEAGETCDSPSQDISCTIPILKIGESVTITVGYEAAEFLDPDDGALYGTQSGDEFKFVFVNDYVLEGSTDSDNNGGVVYLTDPEGNKTEIPFVGTKNEIFFDPDGDGPEAGFTMHLSCSDTFTGGPEGGFGVTAGPVYGVDDWQIASYSILRYNNNGNFFKGCGDVVVPWDVSNTAYADGADSNSELDTDEQVSSTATVQIIRQLKIDIRNDPVIKGKKMDVLLANTGEDALTITKIEVSWPATNGALKSIVFGGNNTIWTGADSAPDATILQAALGGDLTIDPGEALKLGFFFQNKTKSGQYTVTVTLEGGLTTEVTTITANL